MSKALMASDVSVAVGKTTLLHPTSLKVAPAEWLSVIGPNGAGKSTLLRALVGATPCNGTVSVGDKPLAGLKRRQRSQLLAWVPQVPTVPPGIKVLDYVLLGRTPHRHPLAAERPDDLAVVSRVLKDLDLSRFAERDVSTLSGGERQRAIICRALAQDAPILLLDEPTTALDLGHQQEVLLLLDRLRNEGRTIISTMHDLTLAGQFADRLVMLAEGRVVAEGNAATVLTEDNLATHYNADVHVSDNNGVVTVVPRVRPRQSTAAREDNP